MPVQAIWNKIDKNVTYTYSVFCVENYVYPLCLPAEFRPRRMLMTQQSKKKNAGYTLTLSDNKTGKSFELPVLAGTLGPSVIDVRRLYAETGMFTYDPGFTSTASSSILVDGPGSTPSFETAAFFSSVVRLAVINPTSEFRTSTV